MRLVGKARPVEVRGESESVSGPPQVWSCFLSPSGTKEA